MWLINTTTLQLERHEFSQAPPYAILSHVWAEDEITFQDFESALPSVRNKAGYRKIQRFADLVRNQCSIQHAWVDTCCIDKTSSAELSEAINSMYRWYRNALVCVVHLQDVFGCLTHYNGSVQLQIESFKQSRWFTRGWTLQELIACSTRIHVGQDWISFPKEQWKDTINKIMSDVTSVPESILWDSKFLGESCAAERMSWGAARETTRPEDRAYSLMGLFGVNMAVLYGEGLTNAFRRLQQEIAKVSFDESMFAWTGPYKSSGLLARTPDDFLACPNFELWRPVTLAPIISTNIGVHMCPCLLDDPDKVTHGVIRAALQCNVRTEQGWMILLIRLQRVKKRCCLVNGQALDAYVRVDCDTMDAIPEYDLKGKSFRDLIVLDDNHVETILKWSLRADSRSGRAHHEAGRVELKRMGSKIEERVYDSHTWTPNATRKVL